MTAVTLFVNDIEYSPDGPGHRHAALVLLGVREVVREALRRRQRLHDCIHTPTGRRGAGRRRHAQQHLTGWRAVARAELRRRIRGCWSRRLPPFIGSGLG
jgi:hypothetical protein